MQENMQENTSVVINNKYILNCMLCPHCHFIVSTWLHLHTHMHIVINSINILSLKNNLKINNWIKHCNRGSPSNKDIRQLCCAVLCCCSNIYLGRSLRSCFT